MIVALFATVAAVTANLYQGIVNFERDCGQNPVSVVVSPCPNCTAVDSCVDKSRNKTVCLSESNLVGFFKSLFNKESVVTIGIYEDRCKSLDYTVLNIADWRCVRVSETEWRRIKIGDNNVIVIHRFKNEICEGDEFKIDAIAVADQNRCVANQKFVVGIEDLVNSVHPQNVFSLLWISCLILLLM